MKRLTALLCLTFAVLLFSAGEAWSLPKCPGSLVSSWHNCFSSYTFPNGGEYVGEWRDGKRHGQGTHTWPDGTRYVGEFRDEKYHGQGTYTWRDGTKYVGEFRDHKKNGQGTYTWADGRKYVGEYRNGKRHGQGTYTWPEGHKYVGEYRNGKRHGQGTYTGPDGGVSEGVWKNGAFQYAREDPKVEERRQKQAMQAIRETCNEFGFREGSESYAQCMLDLFKLEQGAIQSQATPNAASDGAAAAAASQNALLEQQQRQLDEMRQQRELNAAIQLMEQGFEMAFPTPKPTTTCRWNEIMQTMTCN